MKPTPRASQVVLIGPAPPPTHGMAAVNAAVAEMLRIRGVRVCVLDTSAPDLDRSLLRRLRRLPRVIATCARLLRLEIEPGTACYMSVSGGFGKWYEVLFTLIARARACRMFLHHHTFAYLDRPSFVARLLMRAAGKQARHVALSPVMGEKLRTIYGIRRIGHVSNAAFLEAPGAAPVEEQDQILRLGFISNVSREKGVFEFLDVMQALSDASVSAKGSIAGPFQDAVIEREVRARVAEMTSVEYVGPKYGRDKDAYYRSLDVLVFPTMYANEAEPLTILEAFSFGVPVVAYGRGAIPELVTDDCGVAINTEDPFLPSALQQLARWVNCPSQLAASRLACRARFSALRLGSRSRLDALLDDVSLGSDFPPSETARAGMGESARA